MTAPLLAQAFPFLLIVAGDGRIVETGPAFERLAGGVRPGEPLTALFAIERPSGIPGAAFVLHHLATGLRLRGQSIEDPATGAVWLLGRPWAESAGKLLAAGIGKRDFAPGDPTLELLGQLDCQSSAIDEVRQVTLKLTRQRQELEVANHKQGLHLQFTRILAEADTLAEAAPRMLEVMAIEAGFDHGVMWGDDNGEPVPLSFWTRAGSVNDPRCGPMATQAMQACRPAWQDAGDGTVLFAFPILVGGRPSGAMAFAGQDPAVVIREVANALPAIGSQGGQFIERKRTEEALVRRTRELEAARTEALQASRLKSEFLAMMSHEVRTPLNGILGMMGLLRHTAMSREQRDYADTVTMSAESLLQILNDILDFSKAEAGRMSFECADFDPVRLAEEAAATMAGNAFAKGLDFVVDASPGTPGLVAGDAARIRQILLNLTGNALKFTTRGQVALSVWSAREGEIRFSVEDTGIGMSAETVGGLFQPFHQADAGSARRFGGTGLGLAISKELAAGMGGSITVTSAPGKGSRFEVSLPVKPPEGVPPPRRVMPGKSLLVIDENQRRRAVIGCWARYWGMEVAEASGSDDALSWLEDNRADVAIVHHALADASAVEFALQIRSSAKSMLAAPLGYPCPATIPVLPLPLRRDVLFAMLSGDAAAAELPATRPASPGQRVLIAEDNLVNQRVALRQLELLGVCADLAATGKEAVAAAHRFPYSLILMDMQMPEMDGVEAAAILRSDPPFGRRVPIVALTANALTEDRARCLAAGMDDFLAKPARIADLWNTVSRWVNSAPPV